MTTHQALITPTTVNVWSEALVYQRAQPRLIAPFKAPRSGIRQYDLPRATYVQALRQLIRAPVLIGPEFRFPDDVLGDVDGSILWPDAIEALTIAVHTTRPRARDLITWLAEGKRIYLRCGFALTGATTQTTAEGVLQRCTVEQLEPTTCTTSLKPSPREGNLFWG